jgi:MoxR-like ATPase
VTAGKLPRAHVAFLDEVFQASSSIGNALLTLLHERRFDGGDGPVDAPLVTLVAAASELPDDDGLATLHDRFLLRFEVGYLREEHHFLQLLAAHAPAARTTLPLEGLLVLREKARGVEVPGAVLEDLAELRRALAEREVVASDRRWVQALDLLRARALLEGRERVDTVDLPLLVHVLWTEPGDREVVEEAIRAVAHGHEDEAERLAVEARVIAEEGERDDALVRLHELEERIGAIAGEAAARGRETDRVIALRDEVRAVVARVLGGETSAEAEGPRH